MPLVSLREKVALVTLAWVVASAALLSGPGQAGAQEPTARPTPTVAPAWTATPTETATPTITPTPTETGTPLPTPTITPTMTATPTQTGTPTLRPVTPISTLDRWYRPPEQATPAPVAVVEGTPGILPVVGGDGRRDGTGAWVLWAGLLMVPVVGGLVISRLRGHARQHSTS